MNAHARFLTSTASFLVALALVAATNAPAAASTPKPQCGFCDEGPVGGGQGHEFGGLGSEYDCAPNTCHATTQVGYCHTYHYDCAVS